MKLFSRWFIVWGASFMFFCSYAVADVTIDINGDMSEWTTIAGVTETETKERTRESDESYLNPDATDPGNVHSEEGFSSGEGYDIETLGLLIDSGTLYLGLDTNFDFTNESNGVISTGDFIFTFYSYDENEIETTTDLALDFSFDTDTDGETIDYLSSLTFYWGDVEFSNATYLQTDLAYGVDEAKSNDSETYTFTPEDWGLVGALGTDYEDQRKRVWNGWYWDYEGSETDYTLELAINLDDLSATLQDIFASSEYVEMHWQMSCGNDILYVADDYSYSATHAPEPATFVLLGLGLLGAGFLERRHQEQKKG